MNFQTPLFLTQRQQLEAVCDDLAAMNAPQLPLWRAAADGRLALAYLASPDAPWPRSMVGTTMPVVALIAADFGDGRDALAPAGWRCAHHLREWCNAAIVHGAGGDPAHYRNASLIAPAARRVAFVECTSAAALGWADFLRCPRTLVILPRGGVHPVIPEVRQ